MDKERQLPLRVAREICQRLIERRLLSASKLPEALSSVGGAALGLSGPSQGPKVLALAGDLTARLIERGRLGTPASAIEALTELSNTLSTIWARLHPAKAEAAIKNAVELALKLLETNTTGSDPLAVTIEKLAQTAVELLPDPPPLVVPSAKSKR
jgi:hypothetical protein